LDLVFTSPRLSQTCSGVQPISSYPIKRRKAAKTISELLTVTAGLKGGYLWLMILVLLFLLVVFAAFLRLIGEAVFGSPPENVTRGDVNFITILPIFLLFILMFGLGVYIPSPLADLLRGAADIVLSGF